MIPCRRAAAIGSVLLLVAACTSADPARQAAPTAPGSTATSAPTPTQPSTASPGATPIDRPSQRPTASPTGRNADQALLRFRAARAMRTVTVLAGRIGPREATSPAFRRAAALVERRLADLGYRVRRQRFPVPAGTSWGIPVESGTSVNVIATPAGFTASRPHRLVGAHLDTVPQAPGAEDNASGVAVLLDLARLAAEGAPRVPTVFVAFGAEEPRGEGDALHHFGSQAYARRMSADQRAALRHMLALDRVGVGATVPVCNGGLAPQSLVRALRAAAQRAGVPTSSCGDNRSSDYWSFEKVGVSAARLGSTPYAEYHSAADLPRVVSRAQLGRTGRLAWEWLSGRG